MSDKLQNHTISIETDFGYLHVMIQAPKEFLTPQLYELALKRVQESDDIIHLPLDTENLRFEVVRSDVGWFGDIPIPSGVQQINEKEANDILVNKSPEGRFFYVKDDGTFVAIDNSEHADEPYTKYCKNPEECFHWLFV